MKPRQFKLIAGKYLHTDGMLYQKGSIIYSEEDLAAKFGKAKFQELGNITVTGDNPSEPPIPAPIAIGIPMGVAAKAETPKTAPKGPEVVTTTGTQTGEQSAPTGTGSGSPGSDSDTVKGEPHPKYGENVTDKFPKAQISKVQVFSNGENFRVVDPESGKAISKKLPTKEKVDSFLEDF